MRSKIKRSLPWVIIVSFTIMLLSAVPAQAGNGDGTGGGKSEPLRLVSSVPADGAKNVPVPSRILLTFSKNVVNMTVNENNKTCFSLQSEAGKEIPVTVFMADDQIEPEKRNDVILYPSGALQSGTPYMVKVSQMLRSKSGVNLQQPVTVRFTTAGAKPAAITVPAASSAAKKVVSPVSQRSVKPSSVKQRKPISKKPAAGGQIQEKQSRVRS